MDPVTAPLLQLVMIVFLVNTLGWITLPMAGKRVSWFWFSSWLFRKTRRFIGALLIGIGREMSGGKK